MPSKRSNKRKTKEDHELSDATTEFLARDEPRRPTKRTRGTSLSRLDDSDDDAGRDGNRGFQTWAKWLDDIKREEAAGTKKWTKAFEQKADKQDKQLRSLLQTHENDQEEQQQMLTSIFGKVYATASQLSSTGNSIREPADDGLSLVKEARDLIADSRMVVKCYTDLNESLKTHNIELPAATLKKDKQDIKELLACGREHGETIANGHLAPHTYSPPNLENGHDAHDHTAADMFQESRRTIQDSVGSVVDEQLQGFRRLVTTMSPERNRA
ncbi:hypothetical protein TruAng_001845 [Truncatella angustata]|nr:hypothetical protein TruAng_001845 [Truncatella angustata]